MMTNHTCAGAGMGSPGLKKALVSSVLGMYRPSVAANSATGRGNPSKQKAHSAPFRLQALFLCPQSCFMAAVRGQTSVWPGSFCPGISTPRIAATQSRGKDRGSSYQAKGVRPMLSHLFALTPEQIRNKIARHRAMAIAQLRSKSSLSVRKRRYDEQMAKARFFEAMLAGGAK
ncbi:ash family protein [Pseudomonas sp. MF6396]|uniref:ash family protein n=1 Tax=Pseudomonas sp. MF6396 TaxID=1960828 RepID=UPI001374844C|nr:ash family protein [Pseudomonas sp. MF6396]